jgi:hypothetical protein
MTQPHRAVPRLTKKSPSPADRSEEFAEVQRRLKREAAERRVKSTGTARRTPPRAATGKARGRG